MVAASTIVPLLVVVATVMTILVGVIWKFSCCKKLRHQSVKNKQSKSKILKRISKERMRNIEALDISEPVVDESKLDDPGYKNTYLALTNDNYINIESIINHHLQMNDRTNQSKEQIADSDQMSQEKVTEPMYEEPKLMITTNPKHNNKPVQNEPKKAFIELEQQNDCDGYAVIDATSPSPKKKKQRKSKTDKLQHDTGKSSDFDATHVYAVSNKAKKKKSKDMVEEAAEEIDVPHSDATPPSPKFAPHSDATPPSPKETDQSHEYTIPDTKKKKQRKSKTDKLQHDTGKSSDLDTTHGNVVADERENKDRVEEAGEDVGSFWGL